MKLTNKFTLWYFGIMLLVLLIGGAIVYYEIQWKISKVEVVRHQRLNDLIAQQISKGGPVTVSHPEMRRFFMTIPEAVQLVLQAAVLGRGGEIFVLDMGEPIRVLDLARDLIRLSGLREGRDIEIVFTGLRPGEKLYEELYEEQESRLATPHPKIFSAQHRPCSSDWLQAEFERLAGVVSGPGEEVTSLLRELVPGRDVDDVHAECCEAEGAPGEQPVAALLDVVDVEDREVAHRATLIARRAPGVG